MTEPHTDNTIENRLAALEAELVEALPDLRTFRAEKARREQIARHYTIAAMPRTERNAAIAGMSVSERSSMFMAIGGDAIAVVRQAPDAPTLIQWCKLLPPHHRHAVEVDLVEAPANVWITGRRNFTWHPATVEVTPAQARELDAAGLILSTHEAPRFSPPSFAGNEHTGTRYRLPSSVMPTLHAVWPMLADQVKRGNVALIACSADENREILLKRWPTMSEVERAIMPPRRSDPD